MASDRPFFNSMRARMTCAFVLLTTLLLLTVEGGILTYLHYTAERSLETKLDLTASRVRGELMETKRGNVYNEFMADNGDSLRMEGIALFVVDGEGQVVQRSQNALPVWPHMPDDGWRIRTLADGPRTLVIGAYWRRSELAWRSEAATLSVLGVCVVIASGLGAWWLVGRTLGPLFSLSHQARQAAKTESLHRSLTLPSDDAEMVELVDTLNALLTNIGETAEAKGRFYAAASHELRTPLQALSGHLEVALSRERSREEYKGVTEEAARQTQRLSALIQGLLLLNQLERPITAGMPYETVDLGEICQRLLTQFQPLVDERHLAIDAPLLPVCEIAAFPQHAEMFVRNLLENAFKYARAGGQVRIRIEAGDAPSLKLFNSFSSQTPLDTEALFEPFYRPDAARASDTGGNGLGLAICRAIAAANGWQLRLDQVEDGIWASVTFTPLH